MCIRDRLKGIPGTNLYGEGGLNSQVAKDFGIYGFKLPSFIVLDKDGKIASRFFYNLGDPETVSYTHLDVYKRQSADSEVADFKKDELHASLLGLMNQYEMNHGLASQNPSFKVSKNFRDVEKKLEGDTDKMLRSQPIFRNYLLGLSLIHI